MADIWESNWEISKAISDEKIIFHALIKSINMIIKFIINIINILNIISQICYTTMTMINSTMCTFGKCRFLNMCSPYKMINVK